jgi:tRNA threonylcarbamoyladenosine biosynthesis protein TsaB
MNNEKPILAIETSGGLCGAAVYFSDDKYFESNVVLKYSHAEKLFDTIDYVLNNAEILLKDLEAIAVSAGPGSFTGLRIGMSAAKGLAMGASLPIIPVPTFEAMVFQLLHFLPPDSEFIIANKVNADELYYAKFQIKANNFIFAEDLQIINKTDLEKRAGSRMIFGNGNKESADLFKDFYAPSPRYIAKWCRAYGKEKSTFNFDFLEPNYLKNFIIKEKKQ